MIQPLSQRDTRWSNNKLGTSSATIGSHGCTITSLAMLLGTTPDIVDTTMTVKGGYTNGNLVTWSKLPSIFKEITKATRYQSYDNEVVSSAIQKYGGCLVEVDGKRIGASKHWVLYIGNQKMIDPWTGVERPTNYYPPTGCAVIEVQKINQIIKDTMNELPEALKKYGKGTIADLVKWIDDEQNLLKGDRETIVRLNDQITQLNKDIKNAFDKGFQEGLEIEKPIEIKKEMTIAGLTWELSGIQIGSDGKVTANYQIIK